MKHAFITFALVSMVLAPHARASDPIPLCDSATAQIVEEQLDSIRTWGQFANFYRTYSRCDRPALSYAFTQRIALLASSRSGIRELQAQIKQDPKLKGVVLEHLRSEAVSADQAEEIRRSVRSKCPRGAGHLCTEVLRAVGVRSQ